MARNKVKDTVAYFFGRETTPNNGVSVQEIHEATGIPKSTLYKHISQLLDQKMIYRANRNVLAPGDTYYLDMEAYHKSITEPRTSAVDDTVFEERAASLQPRPTSITSTQQFEYLSSQLESILAAVTSISNSGAPVNGAEGKHVMYFDDETWDACLFNAEKLAEMADDAVDAVNTVSASINGAKFDNERLEKYALSLLLWIKVKADS